MLSLFLLAGGLAVMRPPAAWMLLLLPAVAELLGKLAMFNVMGLVINGVLLIRIFNGLRGAWALRRGFADPEAAAAVFE